MTPRFVRLLILTITVTLPCWPIALGQSGANTDPLKPYTTCKVPGGLKIKEVKRRPSGDNFREVETANGKEKVSVTDGYRVMFAYPDVTYYYANVKIEQSAPDSYLKDKEILINQLKHYSSPEQSTPKPSSSKQVTSVFSDKSPLNGFEHYGMDLAKIDVGGSVGVHVLFYDPAHLVITVYFLNQSKAAFLNNRRFESIDEYRQLRDDFLNHYSECLKRVAGAQP